jgi:hypothetical protein
MGCFAFKITALLHKPWYVPAIFLKMLSKFEKSFVQKLSK